MPFLGDGYLVGGVKPIIYKNKPLGKVAQILLSSSTMGPIAKLTLENYEQSKREPEANRKKEVINIRTEMSETENREHPSNQN